MPIQPATRLTVEFKEPLTGTMLAAIGREVNDKSFILCQTGRRFSLGQHTHMPYGGVRFLSEANFFPELFSTAEVYASMTVEHFNWGIRPRPTCPETATAVVADFVASFNKVHQEALDTGEFPDTSFLRMPMYPTLYP